VSLPVLRWPADRPLRAVFMGTPAFAVPSLRALARAATLVGVVSQPDRPRGRGLTSQPSPVAAAAAALDVPVLRPPTVRDDAVRAELAAWRPDVLVVAAYGKILPPPILALPILAPINVHASLLPRHRGAAPIAAAILAGDTETGVTIMLMREEMDAGEVLLQRASPIGPEDTTATLTATLADLGAAALVEAIERIRTAGLTPIAQDAARVTYASRLGKEAGRIDWSHPAVTIARAVRAYSPWQSAYSSLGGRTVKILTAKVAAPGGASAAPGTIVGGPERLMVATGSGTLELVTVQAEGRKALPAAAFLAGARLEAGARFT